jgi:two-component sensor histidine kinase
MSDVSEARRQRDEQAAQNMRLARSITETHHRVKNHLQLISAVVELQIDDQEMVPTSALKRIGHHARSLAALHDLLTNESKVTMRTDSISTRAAFDKLIALMQIGVVGRAICCDVDDFRLPVREGASVALLVSELVSNAIKHGCGDIHVGLHADDECVRLVVADDGPGFPQEFDWRSAANTGLGIIESTGRYDLRGAVHYENREEGGGRVTITFPMPAPRPV